MLSPTHDVRQVVDALAARAWPPIHAEALGDWLLRHSPGVGRRRLNSALPTPDRMPDDLDVVLAEVIRFYRARELRPLIQLTPLALHAELDGALAARGWETIVPTDVLAATTADVLAASGSAPEVRIAIERHPGGAWLDGWRTCEGRSDARETCRTVLSRVAAPAACVVARIDDELAGVGLGVTEEGWTGIFCMATARPARRRGVARSILHALADWSGAQSAPRLYLQVEKDNAPARALYETAGFAPSHDYHFRVAPGER